MLLYPEGMVKLNGSAGEIMKRCDGERSVAAIVAELEQAFTARGLEGEVLAFVDDGGTAAVAGVGMSAAACNPASARRCGCWRS